MNDLTSQPHLDESATIRLAQVRETLTCAVVEFRADITLYRALNHAIGAIEDRLGRPRTLPNRRERRRGSYGT